MSQTRDLLKRIETLERENRVYRDALIEVSGCSAANLCEGCLLSIKCALEKKSLGDLFKESKRSSL